MTRKAYIRELLGRIDDFGTMSEFDCHVADKYGCSEAAARAARLRVQKAVSSPEETTDKIEADEDVELEDIDQRELHLIHDHSRHKAFWRPEDAQYVFWLDVSQSRKYKGAGIRFDIPGEQVQWMIERYVHEGHGYTQKKICRRFWTEHNRRMDPALLQWVLRALGVDKNSIPFAPHVYRKVGDQEADRIARSWLARDEGRVEQRKREIEHDHWKERALELKEKLCDVEMWVERLENIDIPCSEIENSIPHRGIGQIVYTPVFLFSDWHVGATKFTTEGIHRRLRLEVDHFLNTLNVKLRAPVVLFGGDMVDGVHGDMHPGQHSHQYEGGAGQVFKAVSMVRDVVGHIYRRLGKRVSCAWVPGNHDRDRPHNSEDPERIISQIMARWLEDLTAEYADWQTPDPHSGIVSMRVKSTQILLYHGDKQPKDWRRLLLTQMDKTAAYHLLVCGHRHSPEVRIQEDLNVMVWRVGTALEYDSYGQEQLGLGTRPSQQVLLIGEYGPQLPGQLMLNKAL